VWYFGDFTWLPTRVSVANSNVQTGQAIAATLEFYKDSTWAPLADARVYAGVQTGSTDSSGHANLSTSDGYYKVFGQKSGYIRSNNILVKVGTPAGNTIDLTVNVGAGHVLGDTIAFTVTPSNLDFGTLKPGQSASSKATVTNTGTQKIKVETTITGDTLLIDNTTINSTRWQDFKANLNEGGTENENVGLAVPSNYTGATGKKNGVVTFWATAQ
jgi:uncharacterized membrane protein